MISWPLPRLSGLLAQVARAHGSARPQLIELRTTFEKLRLALEPHLAWEEQSAFPAFRAAGSGGSSEEIELLEALDGLRALTLDMHEHVHAENNILFPRVRELVQ